MSLLGPAKALNVLVSEGDRWQGKSLVEQIVKEAHDFGLAGATVLRGSMGFGIGRLVHSDAMEATMDNLPLSILMVDEGDKIERFKERLGPMIGEGLVETWDVQVEWYRAGDQP